MQMRLTHARSGPYVLVVEDDPALSQTIQWALEDEGLKVVGVDDGWQALELALLRRPSLVVLDLKLPRLDGEDVVAGLAMAQAGDVPILLVSGDQSLAAKAKQLGVFGHLQKPFDVEDLIRIVWRGLGKDAADLPTEELSRPPAIRAKTRRA